LALPNAELAFPASESLFLLASRRFALLGWRFRRPSRRFPLAFPAGASALWLGAPARNGPFGSGWSGRPAGVFRVGTATWLLPVLCGPGLGLLLVGLVRRR
jgi:hypothetical protein